MCKDIKMKITKYFLLYKYHEIIDKIIYFTDKIWRHCFKGRRIAPKVLLI